MTPSDYVFHTTWRVRGDLEEVRSIITDGADYPRWWPAFCLAARELEPGDELGVGRRVEVAGLATPTPTPTPDATTVPGVLPSITPTPTATATPTPAVGQLPDTASDEASGHATIVVMVGLATVLAGSVWLRHRRRA